jgi:hypothetical protein
VLLAVPVVLVGTRGSCRCWALVAPAARVARVMPGVVTAVLVVMAVAAGS